VFKRHARFGAEDDLCAGALRQFVVAADKIGVKVSLDYVLDFQPESLGFFNVLVDVALRVYDRGLAVGANQIRRMRQTPKIELFEVHGSSDQTTQPERP
jgi:hypothetical protein